MSLVPYFVAAAGSSTLRIVEMFFSIPKDAERYLNHEINFKEATDGIVKNIHIYVPLTTAKLICDTIVLSTISKWIYDVLIHVRYIFKGLINYGLEAFKNAIKLSLNHIFTSLRSCSIGLILSQFKHIYDKHEKVLLSISIIDFFTMCNHIYLLIISQRNGFKKNIQLELMKYWLECMGIIRAVAESNNIDFVKYMNKCYLDEIYINNTSSSNNEHFFEWKRVKDPDFIQIITISLEDIFHGKVCDVIVKRKIRDINKQIPEIEEATYQVIIEPGCVDGKTFRFIEAGHKDPVNIPADLVVTIRTEPHRVYERSGSNLIYIAKISLQQALDGLPVQIPLIDGRTEEFYSNDIINPHTEFIIDQAGLPDPTNNGIRGRLIVKFDIDFPDYKLGREPVE
ncbi:unnamed protein product [Rotaria sordida]|uniref:Chaperone DnaJ C-terminal domain-containing protein n=1 Tax=Rotaria sordida TaxID=392033 RepID=A0A818TTC3_9BILA|nr:unnamed protein product [Rotaria sordida]